jgi:hypothetical protein
MSRMTGSACLLLLGICGVGVAQQPVIIEPPPDLEAEQLLGSFPEDGYFPQDGYYCPESPIFSGYPCTEWWCRSWYFRVEAIALQRTRGTENTVLVESAAGTPLLATSDLNYHLQPGVSAMLGRRIDSESAWEASYFGANQWQADLRVASLANLDFPDPLGAALDDFNNADVFTIESTSTIHNAEVNYYHDFPRVSGMIGFRYVNWAEDLTIRALDNDGDRSAYDLETHNNLYGGQLGVRIVRQGPRCYWELTGKAGIFGNEAQQRQSLFDDDNTVSVRNGFSRDWGAAFVGDANLSFHCPLTEVLSLRAGYNLLVVTNLALAADQVDFTNNLNSGTIVSPDGTVFVHGLNVGLEALW